jgi:hypothetical protein
MQGADNNRGVLKKLGQGVRAAAIPAIELMKELITDEGV